MYILFGNFIVFIICLNNILDVMIIKLIYVGNDCYLKVGLFEWKYLMLNEFLFVFIVMDVYIYSRINVYCFEYDIKYNWIIWKINLVGVDLEVVNYINFLGINVGMFLVMNGLFVVGYYKIELNVIFSFIYFYEYMYMIFKDLLLFLYIFGGSIRIVLLNI